MMFDQERIAHCLSCGKDHPAATGVCPHCGAPSLAPTFDGAGYRVVVPDIPSAQQRAELITALKGALDCVHDDAEMDAQLSRGNVHVLCGGLGHEAAQTLAGYVKKSHVSPIVEPDTPAGGGGSRVPVGVGLIVVALVLAFLLKSVLGIILGAVGVIAGVVLIVMTLVAGGYRRGAALCSARGSTSSLPGWDAMPTSLSRLLVGLEEPARGALSQVAADVAQVQDGIEAQSMAGIAAGGPGGGLDNAAQKLLAGAVTTARKLVDEKGEAAELTAALQKLAVSAGQARRQFDKLGESAAAKVGVNDPETPQVDKLTGDVAAELEAATKALDDIV